MNASKILNRLLFAAFFFAAAMNLQAQTWNGSASSDWNDPANWTGGVPASGSSVTIPAAGSITNWPKLNADITLNWLTMESGSSLDVNGRQLTVTGVLGLNIIDGPDEVTIDNSAGGDIIFNLGTGGTNKQIGKVAFTKNVIFNLSGSCIFYDGYGSGATRYLGNVTYNIATTAAFTSANHYANEYRGNLTVTRTVPGATTLFREGLAALTGNFSYTNTAGGSSAINASGQPANAAAATIGGTVNINVNAQNNGYFNMQYIKNSTAGGAILVENVGPGFGGGIYMYDNVLLAGINLNGYLGVGDFYRNDITGSFTLTQAIGNSGYTSLGGNHITGNTTITQNSSATFSTGITGPDVYDGDFSLTKNGTGAVYIANNHGQDFNGNVILNAVSGLTISDNLVTFGGSNNSTLEHSGTQPLVFPRIRMNKTGGAVLTLNDPVTIATNATFDNGCIVSSAGNYLRFNNNAVHYNASATSHVVGVVHKAGNQAFTFPTGTAASYNPVAIAAPAVATDVFSAEYKQENPTVAGYNTADHVNTVQSVSRCEYWNVQRLNGTSEVKLTFTFNPPCAGGAGYVSDPAALRVMHWNGATWKDLGNGGYTGSTTGTVTTAEAVSSFSPFTFGSADAGSNPLPVTFGSITATMRNGALEVKWVTESETSNSHFNIQVSRNGTDFTTIATVPSEAPGGTTDQVMNYEQTIPLPAAALSGLTIAFALVAFGVRKRRSLYVLTTVILWVGSLFACSRRELAEADKNEKLFVRIEQVDIDGTTSYSKVVQVVRE
ncbi:autotransporter outer membrane beta-barrel domain-containing protein [Niabella aquatica]